MYVGERSKERRVERERERGLREGTNKTIDIDRSGAESN